MSPSSATRLIRSRRPEMVIESNTFLGEGDFCIAFLVNGAWVFRFARHEDYGLDFLSRVLYCYLCTDREALLRRVYRFFELDAIDWAIRCRAARSDADLAGAIIQLRDLRIRDEQGRWL